MESSKILIPDEVIINQIYLIKGQKVMIDRDLAKLYGVETKRLKEVVRRNLDRFPDDFMFQMSQQEFEIWRKEISLNQEDIMGLRHIPFCFTEQGVTMLSCILRSKQAIQVNIRVIRIFTKLREIILTHKDILLKLEQIEKVVTGHNDEIQIIFDALKKLMNHQQQKQVRTQVGYKIGTRK